VNMNDALYSSEMKQENFTVNVNRVKLSTLTGL